MDKPSLRQLTPVRTSFPQVKSGVRCGPNRRPPFDHIGNVIDLDSMPVQALAGLAQAGLLDTITKS